MRDSAAPIEKKIGLRYSFFMEENLFKRHYEGEKFVWEDFVYFGQCDSSGSLSVCETLRLLTNVATEAYRQKGLSWQFLRENEVAILASRQSFRFHRMPLQNTKIRIETWEEPPQPLQLVRAYEFFDAATQEPLVSGLSTWLVVNLKMRSIMRPCEFSLHPGFLPQTEHDCLAPKKIAAPTDAEFVAKRKICFSDIDMNGHATNAQYAAFVFDALGAEMQKKVFSDFRINYSKEARLGDELALFAKTDDEAKKITVIGKNGDNICFESELFWQ